MSIDTSAIARAPLPSIRPSEALSLEEALRRVMPEPVQPAPSERTRFTPKGGTLNILV